MSLLLHPRQKDNIALTRSAIGHLEKTVFSGKKLIKHIKSEIDIGKKKKMPSSATISENLLRHQFKKYKAHDCLLSFIFIAWAWLLLPNSKDTKECEADVQLLADICDGIVDLIDKQKGKSIRDFISQMRKVCKNAQSKLGPRNKQDKKRLTRFYKVSRNLNNMLFSSQKRAQITN
jgi:hypothetical protein